MSVHMYACSLTDSMHVSLCIHIYACMQNVIPVNLSFEQGKIFRDHRSEVKYMAYKYKIFVAVTWTLHGN